MTFSENKIILNNFRHITKISKLKQKYIKQIISQFFLDNQLTINYLDLNFVKESDMLSINIQHLHHDYHTDIITFNLSHSPDHIIADMYINVDMLAYNAQVFQQSIDTELVRLILHGCLHLIGYEDKTKTQKAKMTQMENIYLQKFII